MSLYLGREEDMVIFENSEIKDNYRIMHASVQIGNLWRYERRWYWVIFGNLPIVEDSLDEAFSQIRIHAPQLLKQGRRNQRRMQNFRPSPKK